MQAVNLTKTFFCGDPSSIARSYDQQCQASKVISRGEIKVFNGTTTSVQVLFMNWLATIATSI